MHAPTKHVPRRARPSGSTVPAALALAALTSLGGCAIEQNDRIEVGGVVPTPLQPQPMTLGRAGDAPSVTSLDRAGWAESNFEVASDVINHRPTYARRLNTYEISSRASGTFPTVADAMTLPGGPSESEQIYDAITWSFMIYPGVIAVPLGIFFERPFQDIHQSPGWMYDRRRGAGAAGEPTGDPLVDRLGLPVHDAAPIAPPAAPRPSQAGTTGASQDAPAPAGTTQPMFEIRPLTPPTDVPAAEPAPGAAPTPGGSR